MQNSIKQGNAIQAVYTMRPPFTSMHLHFLAALCCFPKIGESASKPWRVLYFLVEAVAELFQSVPYLVNGEPLLRPIAFNNKHLLHVCLCYL